jgi:hypothetical protein
MRYIRAQLGVLLVGQDLASRTRQERKKKRKKKKNKN